MSEREPSPADPAASAAVSAAAPLAAVLAGRCPRCGGARLFSGYLKLAPGCRACGLDYGFADSGDGPAVFIIFIVGFIAVGGALVTEVAYQPPYWLHALIWGPLIVLLPLLLLRPAKALMVAVQYRHNAAQGRLDRS